MLSLWKIFAAGENHIDIVRGGVLFNAGDEFGVGVSCDGRKNYPNIKHLLYASAGNISAAALYGVQVALFLQFRDSVVNGISCNFIFPAQKIAGWHSAAHFHPKNGFSVRFLYFLISQCHRFDSLSQ